MTDDAPLTNRWIRDEFHWDRMSDVRWDIVINNLRSTEYIIDNPDKFPKADMDAMSQKEFQLRMFCLENGR